MSQVDLARVRFQIGQVVLVKFLILFPFLNWRKFWHLILLNIAASQMSNEKCYPKATVLTSIPVLAPLSLCVTRWCSPAPTRSMSHWVTFCPHPGLRSHLALRWPARLYWPSHPVIHGSGHGLHVPGDVVDEHCAHHKQRAFLRWEGPLSTQSSSVVMMLPLVTR